MMEIFSELGDSIEIFQISQRSALLLLSARLHLEHFTLNDAQHGF